MDQLFKHIFYCIFLKVIHFLSVLKFQVFQADSLNDIAFSQNLIEFIFKLHETPKVLTITYESPLLDHFTFLCSTVAL